MKPPITYAMIVRSCPIGFETSSKYAGSRFTSTCSVGSVVTESLKVS
jgi:hypothetical protein